MPFPLQDCRREVNRNDCAFIAIYPGPLADCHRLAQEDGQLCMIKASMAGPSWGHHIAARVVFLYCRSATKRLLQVKTTFPWGVWKDGRGPLKILERKVRVLGVSGVTILFPFFVPHSALASETAKHGMQKKDHSLHWPPPPPPSVFLLMFGEQRVMLVSWNSCFKQRLEGLAGRKRRIHKCRGEKNK